MDDNKPSEEKVRKTLTLTHKQAGLSAIVGAVLFALQPTLAHFQTKDVADLKTEVIQTQLNSVISQQADIKNAIRDTNLAITANGADIVTRLRLLNEAIKQREIQAETRQKSTDDRQDRYIEMVLQAKGMQPGRRSITN